MADTIQTVDKTLKRPEPAPRDKLIDFHLAHDEAIPSVEDVDMKTFDVLDPELWRRDAFWPEPVIADAIVDDLSEVPATLTRL